MDYTVLFCEADFKLGKHDRKEWVIGSSLWDCEFKIRTRYTFASKPVTDVHLKVIKSCYNPPDVNFHIEAAAYREGLEPLRIRGMAYDEQICNHD